MNAENTTTKTNHKQTPRKSKLMQKTTNTKKINELPENKN